MAKLSAAEISARWKELIARCGWTGKIPPDATADAVRAADAAMRKAQTMVKADDWTGAEIQVRGAVGMLVFAHDASREGKREAQRRVEARTEADHAEAAAKADTQQHEDAIANAWSRDAAWALVCATVDAVGETLNPCPPVPEGSARWSEPIDDAWKTQDMPALREACEEYERRWVAWWAEQGAA